MKKSFLYGLSLCAASLLGLGMYACSDNSTITFTPESGSVLSVSETITVKGVKKDDFELGGNLAALADQTWDGDTLVLTPKTVWNGGQGGVLTVTPNGKEEATANYGFKVSFTTYQKASVVIGQPDFTSNSSNQGGGAAANHLSGPYGLMAISDKGALVMTDTENNRALIFNKIPTTNNVNANHVIGQANMTANLSGIAVNKLHRPEGALFYKGKLLVKDYDNARILVYNSVPTSNDAAADVVVGQVDFGTSDSPCTRKHLSFPEGFWITPSGKLLVADTDNNRIMIWNEIPTVNGKNADLVLGQADFTHCDEDGGNAEPSAKTLDYPAGIWSDDEKIIVVDADNYRVLIWNKFPTENFVKADVVVGQNNFINSAEEDDNQDGTTDNPSARVFGWPYHVYSNGTQLFVEDNGNNRILIWNEIPTKNFTKANVVLGQENFTNQGDGTSDKKLAWPSGITLHGNQLFVADNGNNRVLIFNGE
jgi:hypothetical protein